MTSKKSSSSKMFMLNYFATAYYTFAMGKPWGGYVNSDVKAAWMQALYCPGHWEAPEQEFDMVQALSSNEGDISPKDTAMSLGSVKAEQVSKQGDYTVQQQNGTFTPFSNSEGEVASSPLKQGEDCHEDPSASHVHGGANATDTREEADNSGWTDNLQLRGNVCQVHPASKWDRVMAKSLTFSSTTLPLT